MYILAIESSCDETSASIIKNSKVLSNVISSQHFHSKYGGVVPELASRAHIKSISEIVYQSISEANISINEINAIAVTTEPGLAGSLIVGSSFAKALSIKLNIPIVPVNHIDGHLFSGCLEDNSIQFPFISLVVSGGHTAIFYVKSWVDYEIIGLTKDDAAGEAFDKIAKLIGLEYPGGPLIDKFAKFGDKNKFDFPRPMIYESNYNFSFSGLKTSVRYFILKNFPNGLAEQDIYDISASVQSAIVDVLVQKTLNAAIEYKVNTITIAGGVSANSYLRQQIVEKSAKYKIKAVSPKMSFCVDNAAMIGFIAEKKLENQKANDFSNYKFIVNSNALRAKR